MRGTSIFALPAYLFETVLNIRDAKSERAATQSVWFRFKRGYHRWKVDRSCAQGIADVRAGRCTPILQEHLESVEAFINSR